MTKKIYFHVYFAIDYCEIISSCNEHLEVVFDMETGDPDDFITFLFLLGHPKVHLKAVTIVPGRD
jgi:hypothetical protein